MEGRLQQLPLPDPLAAVGRENPLPTGERVEAGKDPLGVVAVVAVQQMVEIVGMADEMPPVSGEGFEADDVPVCRGCT